jgi:6-phosphofructokinase 1
VRQIITSEGVEQTYADRVVAMFDRMGLGGLIVIGGDGTFGLAHRFCVLGIPIVGVPKTIDNDIFGTINCFGFDTAVSFATDAIDRLHTTAEAHRRVMVVEVMGRYAGWIALHAGMGGGADVILLPDFPTTSSRSPTASSGATRGAPISASSSWRRVRNRRTAASR